MRVRGDRGQVWMGSDRWIIAYYNARGIYGWLSVTFKRWLNVMSCQMLTSKQKKKMKKKTLATIYFVSNYESYTIYRVIYQPYRDLFKAMGVSIYSYSYSYLCIVCSQSMFYLFFLYFFCVYAFQYLVLNTERWRAFVFVIYKMDQFYCSQLLEVTIENDIYLHWTPPQGAHCTFSPPKKKWWQIISRIEPFPLDSQCI